MRAGKADFNCFSSEEPVGICLTVYQHEPGMLPVSRQDMNGS
ncbi:hypothetical protein SLEP1_g21862 [Rubroshorea leprosula]|uniref:Uncharacterized protein n=1 Tax=Rubroshorea leprosula TaxID=152421 RepID=A0AAV5JAH0_9ROSI|nr:hypothetical protein SLEP1_g21862 [Rubroshorea leprosula]